MSAGLTCVGYLWSCASILAAAFVCAGFYTPYWLRGALTHGKLKFTSAFTRTLSLKDTSVIDEQHFSLSYTAPPSQMALSPYNRIRQTTISYDYARRSPQQATAASQGSFAKPMFIATYFGCFRRCNYWSRTGVKELCGRYTNFNDIPSVWWQLCTILTGVGCSLAVLVAFISVPACCATDIVSRSSGRAFGIVQVVAAVLICAGCITFPMGWDNSEVRAACGEKSGRFLIGSCVVDWSYYLLIGGTCLLYVCASLSTISGRPIEWNELKTDKTISV